MIPKLTCNRMMEREEFREGKEGPIIKQGRDCVMTWELGHRWLLIMWLLREVEQSILKHLALYSVCNCSWMPENNSFISQRNGLLLNGSASHLTTEHAVHAEGGCSKRLAKHLKGGDSAFSDDSHCKLSLTAKDWYPIVKNKAQYEVKK